MWMRRADELLKALAEPLRWRIVELLAGEELCVCHLVEALDVPQPLVSHHLRVLRDAGLVETRAVPVLDLLPAPARRRSPRSAARSLDLAEARTRRRATAAGPAADR